MNIFSKLPFFNGKSDDAVSEEAAEIQAKADRIKHHRDNVRNGPVKERHITSGQYRRSIIRTAEAEARKSRSRQIKGYFQTQQTAATVRGHLQAAGILPYAVLELDPFNQVVSAAWLVQRFGIEVPGTGRVSFAHDDVLTALEGALAWYGKASQTDVAFPEDYVVPVYVQEDAGDVTEGASL